MAGSHPLIAASFLISHAARVWKAPVVWTSFLSRSWSLRSSWIKERLYSRTLSHCLWDLFEATHRIGCTRRWVSIGWKEKPKIKIKSRIKMGKKKILLIEDHAQMRENLILMLEMQGFAVLWADQGLRGLELARSAAPDLILCDVMMPGLDGHGVLQALRAEPPTATIPFIFLTAKGEKLDQRVGMNLGADDYLVKPVGKEDLLAAISARLQRQQQHEESAQSQLSQVRFSP